MNIAAEFSEEVNLSTVDSRQTVLPTFIRSFVLEPVFEFQDFSDACLEKRDVDKAYALKKRKIEFGKDLLYARELVGFYKAAMFSRHSEKGGKICEELISIIKSKSQSAPEEIESYAKKLENVGKSMKAILFYQIALHYYLDSAKAHPKSGATGATLCCEGIRNASKNLLKKRADLKSLIQHHVIPIMQEIRKKVELITGVDEDFLCNCVVKCIHCVEYTEGRVGDFVTREATLKEGIRVLERQLGNKCKQYGVYSLLLNNLACTFEVTGRYEAACIFYAKAVKAHKSAEDYQDEMQRKSDMESSERGLKRAKEKFKKSAGNSGPGVGDG